MNSLKGTSKLNIRLKNAEKILAVLHHKGPCSRLTIAAELGLTVPGISGQITEMLEKGIILELHEEIAADKPGKNSKLLSIDYSKTYTLGCHIADDRAYAGIADLSGKVVVKSEPVPFEGAGKEDVCRSLLDALDDVLGKVKDKLPIGIGVSVNGEIFGRYHDRNEFINYLTEKVNEKYPFFPIVIEKASRAMAVAEIDYGTDHDIRNMVFLQVSNSMDMGIVLNGELYSGAHDHSGWLDHVVVDPNGEMCECGKRGCVKTVLTVNGVLNRVRRIYSRENTPVLYELTEGDALRLQYDHLKIASLRGEQIVSEIYRQDYAFFSSLLLNFVNIIDPEKFVIQGIGLYADEFIDELNHHLRHTLGDDYRNIYKLSILNQDNIFLGGNAIAAKEFFYTLSGEM